MNKELSKTNSKLDDTSQQYTEIKSLFEEPKKKMMSDNMMNKITGTITSVGALNCTLPFTNPEAIFEASNVQHIINSSMKI